MRRCGEQLEECDREIAHEALLPRKPNPPETMYGMVDGTMLSMQDGSRSEVKLGVVFSKEDHIRGDANRRGTVERARYVAILANYDEFKEEMKAAVHAERWISAKQVVWIGDGAAWVWNLANETYPQCIEILDWYHAVENGMDAARISLGDAPDLLPLFKTRLEQLLSAGDVDALIHELMDAMVEADDVGVRVSAGHCPRQTTDPPDVALDESSPRR